MMVRTFTGRTRVGPYDLHTLLDILLYTGLSWSTLLYGVYVLDAE